MFLMILHKPLIIAKELFVFPGAYIFATTPCRKIMNPIRLAIQACRPTTCGRTLTSKTISSIFCCKLSLGNLLQCFFFKFVLEDLFIPQ